MAKLNRIAMDLIQKSNKPENLKGLVAKGYAFDYAEYLIDKGLELPQIIVDYISNLKWGNDKNSLGAGRQPKIINFVIKMKEKGIKIPDHFIETIFKDETYSEYYIIDLIKKDLFDKIEPEIYEHITKDGYRLRRLLLKMEEEGVANYNVFPVPVLNKMLNLLTQIGSGSMDDGYDEDVSYFCADILDTLMMVGAIKSFKQIDPRTLYVILNKKNSTVFFINSFLRSKLKDLPKEIDYIVNKPKPIGRFYLSPHNRQDLDEILSLLMRYKENMETNKVQESFSSWFKKRY